MADGSVLIDTKLDPSGLKRGLAALGAITGSGLLAAVSALASLSTAAIKVGIDFESAFAGVKKTLDTADLSIDETTALFSEMRQGILDMSQEIPVAADEIAGIAEAAGQLGIERENILGFTRVMADLGVATNMTSDQAATSLARLANITGMSEKDFDRLGSTIVALGNSLATTESDITEMALRLAGTGKQVGMTEDQILSMAGAFSSVGMNAEAGGSAVSRVLTMMQLACEQGGTALDQLAGVAGMTGAEFKAAFEEDAASAFQAFIEGLNNAEESGQSAIGIIAKLGETTELSALDTVVIRDALLRAAGASDVLSDALDTGSRAWEENNALTNEANQRYATMESQLKIFKNTAVALGIAVYDGLRDPMLSVVTAATDMMQQLNAAFNEGGFEGLAAALGDVLAQIVTDIAEFAPTLIESGMSLLDALAEGLIESAPTIAEAATVVFGQLLEAFFSLTDSLLVLASELLLALCEGLTNNSGKLIEAVTTGLGMILDTIVAYLPQLLVAGANLLIALTTGLVNALPTLVPQVIQAGTSLLTALIQGLPTVIQSITAALPKIVTSIVTTLIGLIPQIRECGIQLLEALVEALPEIISAIVAVLPEIVTAIVSALVSMIPQLIQCGVDLLVSLVENLPAIIEMIVAALPQIISAIVSALASNIPQIIQAGVQLLTSLVTNLPQIIATLIRAVPQIITALVNGFRAGISSFVSAGRDMLLGLGNGIANAVGSVVAKAKAACSRILSSVKGFFGIHSPSRLFRDVIGENLMLGLAEGITAEAKSAVGAAEDASKKIADVDFQTGPFDPNDPDGVDYDALVNHARSTVIGRKIEDGSTISSGSAGNLYRGGGEATKNGSQGQGGDKPKYVQNDIYIDGKKTARVITPYVSKELEWEGK